MKGWTPEEQDRVFQEWWASHPFLEASIFTLDQKACIKEGFIRGWQEGHRETLKQLGPGATLWDSLENVVRPTEEDAGYRTREKVARRVLNFVLGKGNIQKGAETPLPKSSRE